MREDLKLRLLFDAFNLYKKGDLSIEKLQQELSNTYSLLEGNIPSKIREAILKAEASVDSIRYTLEEPRQHEEIIKIINRVETIVEAAYDDTQH